MATVPTPVPPRKPKKIAAPKAETHTITITFEEKYKTLYEDISVAAEADDRTISQYVLLYLRDNHQVEKSPQE